MRTHATRAQSPPKARTTPLPVAAEEHHVPTGKPADLAKAFGEAAPPSTASPELRAIQRKARAARGAAAAFEEATRGGAAEVPFRAEMEQAFGRDFSGVRAHLGQAGLGAHAVTGGDTIAFTAERPSREVVAHELTHVAQQPDRGSTVAPESHAAEREAESLAPRAAAGARVDVSAQAPAGLYLMRYKAGDKVTLASNGNVVTIISVDEKKEKYRVLTAAGKELLLSELSIAEPEERKEEPSVASSQPASSSSGSVDESRFPEIANDIKLDLSLMMLLDHEAAAAANGNPGNLRGKLAQLIVQHMLTEREADTEKSGVLQDVKVGEPNADYGVRELADLDHVIVDETAAGLKPRAIVETKSGRGDTPDAVRRMLVRKHEQLRKVEKGKVRMYGANEAGKPGDDETDLYDRSDLKNVELLSAGPLQPEKEAQFDIPLPFTPDQMDAFTDYAIRRYLQLRG